MNRTIDSSNGKSFFAVFTVFVTVHLSRKFRAAIQIDAKIGFLHSDYNKSVLVVT